MGTCGIRRQAMTQVSRTIADLEGSEQMLAHHVSEAINYRTLDRRLE